MTGVVSYSGGVMHDDEIELTERMDCPECDGTGSVREIQGDGEGLARCPSCGGMGWVLSRDEWTRLDALQGDKEIKDAA